MRNLGRWGLVAMMAAVTIAPVSAEEAVKKKDKEEVVCKRTQKTGTRFASRVCHTPAEWDRITEEHKRAAAEAMNAPAFQMKSE